MAIIFKTLSFLGNIAPHLSPIERDHFDSKYETFWEEFLFIADHGDIPKVRVIITLFIPKSFHKYLGLDKYQGMLQT